MACFMLCLKKHNRLSYGNNTPTLRSVIRRLLQFFSFLAFVVLAMNPVSSVAADDIQINTAKIESSDNTYRLLTSFSLDFNHSLEETLLHGIPLYFKTEIEIRRPRAFWFDDVPVSKSRTTRISYNVLTRQYSISIPGTLQRNYGSLEDVLSAIRYPPGWAIADISDLEPGEKYHVSVRVMLDVSQLPKPFQINALNNRDWRLASEWKRFSYVP